MSIPLWLALLITLAGAALGCLTAALLAARGRADAHAAELTNDAR